MIEECASRDLRELVRLKLWTPDQLPVPVDHIAERVLRLSLTWDVIEHDPDEVIYGCLRPASRELVLNERHADFLSANPGVRNFTVGHEAGHARMYALADHATDQLQLFAREHYRPRTKVGAKGLTAVCGIRLAAALRGKSPEVRYEVLHRLLEAERGEYALGKDTTLERRTVDRYATAVLMPRDVVTAVVRDVTRDGARRELLADWLVLAELARSFEASKTAFRIRLEELGFIYGVEGTRILLEDPTQRDQGSLFG